MKLIFCLKIAFLDLKITYLNYLLAICYIIVKYKYLFLTPLILVVINALTIIFRSISLLFFVVISFYISFKYLHNIYLSNHEIIPLRILLRFHLHIKYNFHA